MTSPQAGWYQDPQNAQNLRYWDGARWTEQTRQQAPTLQAPQPSAPRHTALERASWAAAPVSFAEAARNLFLKPSTKGRASRSEYWFAALAYFLVCIVTGTISGVVPGGAVSTVISLVQLVVLVELLLVAARRYHDRAKSGAWILLQVAVSVVSFVVMAAALLGAAFSSLGGSSESAGTFSAVGLVGGAVFFANLIWCMAWLVLPGKTEQNQYDS